LKLNKLSLNSNQCIKEDFDETQMSAMPKIVKSSCGFCELNKPIEVKVCEIFTKVQKIAGKQFEEIVHAQQRLQKTVENLRLHLHSEVPTKMSHATRIARLEAELLGCKHSKDQAEKQFSLIKEFADKLDAHRTQKCQEKTQELRKTITAKKHEIDKLTHELKEKTDQLEKKQEIINHLEKELTSDYYKVD
jgi:chromosome segregation ATPase